MAYKKRMDLHTHTDNSPDGHHSPMYMCESAELKGLRAIAFTDHCEVDSYYKDHYDRACYQSYFEMVKARSAFMGKLIVAAGIELGQPGYDTKLADEILAARDYDVVIGSVHNLRDREDFYFMDYTGKTAADMDPLLEEYFKELHTMAQWGNFDIFAHLTYPLRYIVGENHIPVNLKKYDDIIQETLKLVAEKGIALEINTSGLRQPIGQTLPTLEYVKRFKDLGGEYITIGSDSHFAEDVGKGIEEGMALAAEAGYTHTVLFQKRIAVPIPIE